MVRFKLPVARKEFDFLEESQGAKKEGKGHRGTKSSFSASGCVRYVAVNGRLAEGLVWSNITDETTVTLQTQGFCRFEQVKLDFLRPFWTKFKTYTKYKKVRKNKAP